MSKLHVIIPAAGPGRRMRSYGAKALIELKAGQKLLERQVSILKKVYPHAGITVVLGFEADKIRRILPEDINIVENKDYENTNVAYSLALALQNKQERVLIVYGDLVFNIETFAELELDKPCVLIDTRNQFNAQEVGLTVIDGQVSQFSYGLSTKWAQIVYLAEQELYLFKKYVLNKDRSRYFGFEILNYVLNHGGAFSAYEPSQMKIAEIDTSKDIELARRIV
jgi:choline kinase